MTQPEFRPGQPTPPGTTYGRGEQTAVPYLNPVYPGAFAPVQERRRGVNTGTAIAGGVAALVSGLAGGYMLGENRGVHLAAATAASTTPASKPSAEGAVTTQPSAGAEAPTAKDVDFNLNPGARITVTADSIIIPAGATKEHPEGITLPRAGFGIVLTSDARWSGNLNADPNDMSQWKKMYDETADAGQTGSIVGLAPQGADCGGTAGSFVIYAQWNGDFHVVPSDQYSTIFNRAVGEGHTAGGFKQMLEYDMATGELTKIG